MTHVQILALPVFPKYKVNTLREIKYYRFNSSIYIHREFPTYVEIYLYPVQTQFKYNTYSDKKKAVEYHLMNCFRISKYVDLGILNFKNLPLVETIDKNAEDFTTKLFYTYP